MAQGLASDFKIYDVEFFGGVSEVQMQNVNAFNGASNGAIKLLTQQLIGDYEKESFYKKISSLVSVRDTTSSGTATDLKLEQGEIASVKLNRKIGPVVNALDAFKKIGQDPRVFSYELGKQWGGDLLSDMLNSAIIAADAALTYSGTGLAAWTVDKSAESTSTLTTAYLADGLAKFGDRAGDIVCWVMHSKVYFDLVKAQIAANIAGISDFNIKEGSPVTFGRPVLVTDSTALKEDDDDYITLGLTADALILKESEERTIVSNMVTGLENLMMRIQGEYAYNLGVKGFTWDYSNGGANPSAASLATSAYWDKVATSTKSFAGVRIRTT